MTTKRRRPSGSDSGSSSRSGTSDAPTRRVGAGNGEAATVNLGALDAMTVRLNNTGGRVDAVGRAVDGVNVGPQSMGIIGGNFTGAAQNHVKTARLHVGKAREAVDNAQTGTKATVKLYRDNELAQQAAFGQIDPDVTPPRVNQGTTTTPSSTTTPGGTTVDRPP